MSIECVPQFIEVCAGAGGMSTGFIHENFEALLLNDNDKTCCATLANNHRETEVRCCDMSKLDLSEYKQIDILMGGVPCQSFSQAGKRKGLQDIRGNLIIIFSDMVKKYNPTVFIIENVKGLLTHNNGETLTHILNTFDSDIYDIKYKILNANDYGVAQKRERLFIIGVKRSIGKTFIFPEKETYKPILRDVIYDLRDEKMQGINYPENKKKILELVPPGGCWVNLPKDIQKKYMGKSYVSGGGKRGMARRLSYDEPSLTLTTSPCQKQTERCHPEFTRPLSIREYGRIQSFPDDYDFCGSITQKYKQIGNAVPVKLAQKIAQQVWKIFN